MYMLWENGEQFKVNIDSVLKIFSVKEESFDNEDIKKDDNLNKTGSINNLESDDIKIASRFNNKFINKIGCKDENELEYEKERLKNFCCGKIVFEFFIIIYMDSIFLF